MCDELRCGPVVLDVERHEVRVDDRPIALTLVEFRILQGLLEQPGRILARRTLQEVAGSRRSSAMRSIDVHVSRLREKLGAARGLIGTVRGRGYRLDPNVAASRRRRDVSVTDSQQCRRSS